MFSVWMPKTNPGIGNVVDVGKWKDVVVTNDLMFLSVAKQKEGEAQDIFMLKVKPHLMQWEIVDEMINVDFNPKKEEKKHEEYMNTWSQQPAPFME